MNLLHALFARNLLMSGVAIVRYIPRAFQVKQVDGNLFFSEEKRQEYRRRVESVTPRSSPISLKVRLLPNSPIRSSDTRAD